MTLRTVMSGSEEELHGLAKCYFHKSIKRLLSTVMHNISKLIWLLLIKKNPWLKWITWDPYGYSGLLYIVCQIMAQFENDLCLKNFRLKTFIRQDSERLLKVKRWNKYVNQTIGMQLCDLGIFEGFLNIMYRFKHLCFLCSALDGVKLKYCHCTHIITRWTQLTLVPTDSSTLY